MWGDEGVNGSLCDQRLPAVAWSCGTHVALELDNATKGTWTTSMPVYQRKCKLWFVNTLT